MQPKKFKYLFLSVNNYLGLSLPIWMESRKSLVINFFLDLLIFFLIFQNKTTYEENFSILKITIFCCNWGLISYLLGRYSKNNKANRTYLDLYFYIQNTFFAVLISYLIDKTSIIFLKNINPFGLNLFLFLGFGSFIIQTSRYILINSNNKISKKLIYIVGEEEDVENFKQTTKSYLINEKLIVINLEIFYKIIKKNQFDFITIIFVSDYDYLENYEIVLRESTKKNLEILTCSEWFEKYLQKIPPEYISKNALNFKEKYLNNIASRVKRFSDILISFFLLIITFPILIISAILIKIEDNGPIFYVQKRTGLYEQIFRIIKLRSMKVNSEMHGPVWSNKSDKRVTKVGFFLRKSRIDELPQLWNVLIGEMSLIGPRPERPEIEENLNKKINHYKFRHIIKPGLSGWAQVNFPYGASVIDSKEKLSYDFFYIKNKSIWLDILIFIKTLKIILTLSGSNPIK